MKRKVFYFFLYIVIAVVIYIISIPNYSAGELIVTLEAKQEDQLQVFYKNKTTEFFSEEYSVKENMPQKYAKVETVFAGDYDKLRLDFGAICGNEISVKYLELRGANKKVQWDALDIKSLIEKNCIQLNHIEYEMSGQDTIGFTTVGNDPYLVLSASYLEPMSYWFPICAIIAVILGIPMVLFMYKYVFFKDVYAFLKSVFVDRKLLFALARNDFKVKFAGSYFGIIWAFVQPVCTILLFWFVFQMGFRSQPISNVPYSLWLSAGLIPWFFFSEAWGSATNAFIEYSYLVKKVVFKIDILPLVKIVAALFVHLFFILFLLGMFGLNGYKPSIRSVEVLYFTFSMACLVLGLSFITSSIVVFFKDLMPIMNIILQFGMWLTPIMWSLDMLPNKMIRVLKLNPMYYVVTGYRYCFIGDVSLIPSVDLTIYFWAFTIFVFVVGVSLFKRLKVHFADVL